MKKLLNTSWGIFMCRKYFLRESCLKAFPEIVKLSHPVNKSCFTLKQTMEAVLLLQVRACGNASVGKLCFDVPLAMLRMHSKEESSSIPTVSSKRTTLTEACSTHQERRIQILPGMIKSLRVLSLEALPSLGLRSGHFFPHDASLLCA